MSSRSGSAEPIELAPESARVPLERQPREISSRDAGRGVSDEGRGDQRPRPPQRLEQGDLVKNDGGRYQRADRDTDRHDPKPRHLEDGTKREIRNVGLFFSTTVVLWFLEGCRLRLLPDCRRNSRPSRRRRLPPRRRNVSVLAIQKGKSGQPQVLPRSPTGTSSFHSISFEFAVEGAVHRYRADNSDGRDCAGLTWSIRSGRP